MKRDAGPRKILYVANVDWAFTSHRLPVAKALISAGWEVHLASVVTDCREDLEASGVVVHGLTTRRGDASVMGVIRTVWQISHLIKQIRPDILHIVTMKMVLVGGLAARISGANRCVAAIAGLGSSYLDKGVRGWVRRFLIRAGLRFVLRSPRFVTIVQNPDDKAFLRRDVRVSEHMIRLIPGSGVDLNHFFRSPRPEGQPLVVLAARLVGDKGVSEFIDAASIIRHRWSGPADEMPRFALVGEPDSENPGSVGLEFLLGLENEGVVEYWGKRSDMPEVFRQASVVALPSYREGMPRVLLEASACGRPVVTTDVPGCRDAVVDGVTGILVPMRDSTALAEAIQRILEDVKLWEELGSAGRAHAESRFSITAVISQHMDIYSELTGDGP